MVARLGGELDRDDALAVLERQRAVQELRDHLEGDRANADGHRHREGADQRQRSVLDQHPDPEAAVDGDVIEPLQPARVAACLFPLFHAAKRDGGLPARLDRIEMPITDQPVGLHLDVEPHLLVHLSVELRRPGQAPPEGAQPRQGSVNHGSPNLTRSREYRPSPSLSRSGAMLESVDLVIYRSRRSTTVALIKIKRPPSAAAAPNRSPRISAPSKAAIRGWTSAIDSTMVADTRCSSQ